MRIEAQRIFDVVRTNVFLILNVVLHTNHWYTHWYKDCTNFFFHRRFVRIVKRFGRWKWKKAERRKRAIESESEQVEHCLTKAASARKNPFCVFYSGFIIMCFWSAFLMFGATIYTHEASGCNGKWDRLLCFPCLIRLHPEKWAQPNSIDSISGIRTQTKRAQNKRAKVFSV